MKEREQILDLWREMRANDSSGVLVTVVKTLGSSYRRPGARLLIAANGQRAGSVSGGCLEDDVVKKAWWLTEKGPLVRRYDTTPDGDLGPSGASTGGFGLGCNGIIYLLMQRVRPGDDGGNPLDVLAQVHATRQSTLLAHVLEPPESVGSVEGRWLQGSLKNAAQGLEASVVVKLLSGEEAFFETLIPPVRLLVFGAGDDAAPLVKMGRYLGWQVAVFDGRAHYARPDRFAGAHQVAFWNAADDVTTLEIDAWTVAVVMTHSYSQDLRFLELLAKQQLAYLGVLGPRNRSLQLLRDAGIDAAALPSLRGPAGLDIGADGPEQVALAITAEIQATMNGRTGGSLTTMVGSIHSGEADGRSAERFVPSIVCA